MTTPRRAAQDAGKKTYKTGKPCKHGHTAYRYTVSGACSDCINPKEPEWDVPLDPPQGGEAAEVFYGPSVYVLEVLERDVERLMSMVDRLCSARFPAIPSAAMQMNLPAAQPGQLVVRMHPYDAPGLQSYAALLARKK